MKLRTRPAAAAGALALTLVLTACGGSADEADSGGGATTQDTTAQTTTEPEEQSEEAHNDADTAFAQMMIVHHEGAIEMADLAVERADSEEVRSLAEGISAAQGPEIEEMTSWLEGWGEDVTPMGDMEGMEEMDSGMDMDGMDQEGAMAELDQLSGADFDRRFLELMIAHHEGAIEMAELQRAEGENPAALELADRIVQDQQAEITEMEQMLQDL
ncbi:DUF305 domain-containing protein [Georgenia muralis]|uniref:Uncharacterized protein (DUF305 family) n=1 Tax=Georgenia muralis TaxID=154117 RepID=A0A3N5A4E8_9MICO|nr:DUF305 domain-containing protein [Georgenia muralis]RPF28235.1 uncharacterized protein (DUF305 family) [Georgenia muralis]